MVASDTGPTITGVDKDNLQQYLNELFQAVLKGELAPEKLAVGIKCAGTVADGCSKALLDVLWLAWMEATPGAPPNAAAADAWIATAVSEDGPVLRIVNLAKDLLKQQMVTKLELLESGDGDFLAATGLVVNAAAWHRKNIRVNTKAVYQQHKFNLLREEGEGFAKLITVLNRVGAASLTDKSLPGLVLEIRGLIGYFDLDPNRAVSLVLLAFAAQPSNKAYLQLFHLFTPAATEQTLGFLFQHHAGPDNSTPDNLFVIAVALIQAGRVRLEALLGHLAPEDTTIGQAVRDAVSALAKEIRGIGVISLSATAADPGKDTGDQPRGPAVLTGATLKLDVRPMAAAVRQPLAANNQKLDLLAALLRAGAWEQGTQLMGWLKRLGVDVVAHPPVASALASEVGALLAPLLAAAFPGGACGHYSLSPKGKRPAKVPLLEPLLMERLALLGLHVANDTALVTRLARVLKFVADWHLLIACGTSDGNQSASAAEIGKVEVILSTVLLPGMMLTPAMPAVSNEVWAVLKTMPYTTRYRLYVQLRETTTSTPLLSAASKLASVELKKVLRRVHVPQSKRDKKEALKPFGRMLAKVAAANPLSVAQTMIAQVEAYPNMVEPYVEALRFMTPMGFDVLTFTIIERLAGSGRGKLKEDGVNISDWLTALCLFAGHAAKLYPAVDLVALAQYLTNQLRAGEGLDLLLLKELVSVMTGVVTVTDLSADQVDAMAGGPALRGQALAFGIVRNAKAMQRGMARLLEALQQGTPEQQLALPLLILLGQQLRVIALQTDSTHLKLVAELYDRAEQTLLQFGDFLQAAMAPADYAALLPPLQTLVLEYGMDPEAAFQLYRPVLAGAAPPPLPASVANGIAAKEEGEEEGEIAEPMAVDDAGKEAAAAAESVPQKGAQSKGGALAWNTLSASVRDLQPPAVWEAISVELYYTFWSLSLYDIYVPIESYAREQVRLTAQLRAKQDAERNAKRELELLARGYAVDPAVVAALPDVPTLQKEIARIQQVLEKLPAEVKAQQKNHTAVMRRLRSESATWLTSLDLHGPKNVCDAFILHCVMPRVKYSAADAMYCAKFIKCMHEMHTPGFSSIQCYDKVIKDMVALVLCSTDAEANNLGIFLQHTMTLMSHWREDPKVYEAECSSSPCFGINFTRLEDNKRASFKDFRKLNFKWQMKLARAFTAALASGEYVQIRNALIVLNRLVKVFPELATATGNTQKAAAKVRDSDKREDLKLLANMYYNTLQAQVSQRPMYDKVTYLEHPDETRKRKEAEAAEAAAARKAAEAEAHNRAKKHTAADTDKPTGPQVSSSKPATAQEGRDRPSSSKAAEPSSSRKGGGEEATGRTAAVAAEGARHASPSTHRGHSRERTGSDAKDASRRDNGRAAEGRDRKQDDASRAPHGDAAASKNVRAEASAATRNSDSRRAPAADASANKLRADAPAFTPPAERSKERDSRASAPTEGDRARPSKRPRTSDVGGDGEKAPTGKSAAERPAAATADTSARKRALTAAEKAETAAAEPPSKRRNSSTAERADGVQPAQDDPDAKRRRPARALPARDTKPAAQPDAAREATQGSAAAADASRDRKPTSAPKELKRRESAVPAEKAIPSPAAQEAAAGEQPQKRKHAPVVFQRREPAKQEDKPAVPAAEPVRDAPDVAAPRPTASPAAQENARDAKTRSSKAHEAEPATVAAAVVASPRGASAFSKAQTQELAAAMRKLPPEANARLSELIAQDPAYREGKVSLSQLSDRTLTRLASQIEREASEQAGTERAQRDGKEEEKEKEKEKEHRHSKPRDREQAPKRGKSEKAHKGDKSERREAKEAKKAHKHGRPKATSEAAEEAIPDATRAGEGEESMRRKSHKTKKRREN